MPRSKMPGASGSFSSGEGLATVYYNWPRKFLPPALFAIVLLVLAGCTPTPRPMYLPPCYGTTSQPYCVQGTWYYPLASARGFTQTGFASWYGRSYQGHRTSSGERYNMYAMTAAHKTLPMETLVKVTNLLNGRSVVVRINDRGPFVRRRIIDLSYEAAKRLRAVRAGVIPVRIRALS